MIEAPIRMAFSRDDPQGAFLVFNTALEIIYWCDLLMKFFTGKRRNRLSLRFWRNRADSCRLHGERE